MGTLLVWICLSCGRADRDGAGGGRGSSAGGAGGFAQTGAGGGNAGSGGGRALDSSCLVATETPISLDHTIVGGGQVICSLDANLSITSCLDYRDSGKEEWIEGVCQTKTLSGVRGIPLEVSLDCSATLHDYRSRVSATANGIIVSRKIESAISTQLQCP